MNRTLGTLAAIAFALCATPAFAQVLGTVSNHAVAVGKGPGISGLGSVAPSTNGNPLVSNGAASDPSFRQLPNSGLVAGSANTLKGSLDGSATSDLAIASCSAVYQFTQWVSGTGWRCGLSPVLPSRAIAATLNLSAFTAITVQGYYNAADGGFMNMTKVGTQPFCGSYTNTAAFQDTGGNWWNIAESIEYNFKQFGAKFDTIQGLSGTDDTAAVQSAIDCAGLQTGAGDDVGGGAGKIVRLPAGWSTINSTIIVRNGVPVLGHSPSASGFVMKSTFANNKHFFILGDQFTQTDVLALQSIAAGGTPAVMNGGLVRSGVAYFLTPQQVCIYAAASNAGVSFTVYGNDRYGSATTSTFAGPAAGGNTCSPTFFTTVTRIDTNGVTNGSISAGLAQIATFASRLQDLQLFTGITTATTFTTSINQPSGVVTGASLNAMVYSNSAQHTAGLKNVKIFAGNRSATAFEQGVGGASTVTFQNVETFNQGNCGACSSNNPQIYWNYGGLLVDMENIVQGGPGVATAGAASICMQLTGGFVNLRNWHCEGIATGIKSSFASINAGSLTMMNGNAASGMTSAIRIDAGVAANSTNVQGIYPNGATHTVDNNGVFNNTNILQWTSF